MITPNLYHTLLANLNCKGIIALQGDSWDREDNYGTITVLFVRQDDLFQIQTWEYNPNDYFGLGRDTISLLHDFNEVFREHHLALEAFKQHIEAEIFQTTPMMER